MSYLQTKTIRGIFCICLFGLLLPSCTPSFDDQGLQSCNCAASNNRLHQQGIRALLASRFNSLEALKEVLQIDYHYVDEQTDSAGARRSFVTLQHCSHHQKARSLLSQGLRQKDITDAANGTFLDRVFLLLKDPYAARNRINLYKVFNLGRRRANVYGYGDVAFYDLALASVQHIIPQQNSFLSPQDSSEKGYLNTFNHITAQAVITACFSEEFADYIADVHERNNLPQLITGKFPKIQGGDAAQTPVDNYVDMINNEWGQSIGLRLKKELNIDATTRWTPALLCQFLNKTQQHYCYAFGIQMNPFRKNDSLILKYTAKMNKVLLEGIIN